MDPFILGAAVYIAVGVSIPLIRRRIIKRSQNQLRRWQRTAADNQPALRAWAGARQWTVTDGTDPAILDPTTRTTYIVGADPVFDPDGISNKFVTGNVIQGRDGARSWLLFDRWYDNGAGEPMSAATMASDATIPHGHLHLDSDGGVETGGDLPAAPSVAAMTSQLRSLGLPARLKMLEGEIIVQCPGLLDVEKCDQLLAVLGWLNRELPRRPGAGPMR
jgi:hypothetical protein